MRRTKVNCLWQLDAAIGAMVAEGIQPAVTQMKLAWWREALAALDERPAPAEPMLGSAQEHLLGAGLTGAELAQLTDGWEYLLDEGPLSPDELESYAGRGAVLFSLSARLMSNVVVAGVESAGKGWALVDLARHSSRPDEAKAALDAAGSHLQNAPRVWPSRLRPLGMLAVLAQRDAVGATLEPQESPVRMLRMLAHRLTGR